MDPWCVRRAGPGLWLVSCPGEVEPALPLCLVSTPVSLSSVPGWTRRSLPTEPQMSSINWSINDRVSDTTVSSCPLVLLLLVQLYFKIHNLTFIYILFIYYYFCNSDLDVFWHLCSSIPPHPHPPGRVFSLHTHLDVSNKLRLPASSLQQFSFIGHCFRVEVFLTQKTVDRTQRQARRAGQWWPTLRQ